MSAIFEIFPGLRISSLIEVTRLIVRERNACAEINRPYKSERLGFAILAANIVRNRLLQFGFQLAADSTVPSWLMVRPCQGLAFLMFVDGVPMRVQPDVPEIREMLFEEATVLRGLLSEARTSGVAGEQGRLFPDERRVVLRMEVAQQSAEPVTKVTLFLFDSETGETLDAVVLYDGATGAYAGGAAPFALPPEDPDTSDAFQLPANDVEKDGNQE